MQIANIETARSYATEAALVKGLERLGFQADRHVVVCTRTGRYTAIFPASNVNGGYLAKYAIRGFLTLG